MQENIIIFKTNPSPVTHSPAGSAEHLLFCQPARFLWGTDKVSIFTVKIATDLACAQRRYPCNTSGFSRQCYSGPQGSHLPIYANPLWFSVSFAKLRPSGPALNFLPLHLPFGDACIFPLSLSYDPLPLQNLASHNLVSRRQSVVVLTVKMVYEQIRWVPCLNNANFVHFVNFCLI